MSASAPFGPLPDTPPTLTGARVLLRAPEPRDAEALFAIFADAEFARYWSTPPMTTIAEARELLARWQHHNEAHEGVQWVVARRNDDRAIGTTTLFRFHPQNHRAEIGYGLGREYWG